jgi:hypothetical protein
MPPQHLHPTILPSQVHTQGHLIYHLPTIGIHSRGAQVAPHGKTCPKLIVYTNLVDTTLTLHAPKSLTQHSPYSPDITSFHHASM